MRNLVERPSKQVPYRFFAGLVSVEFEAEGAGSVGAYSLVVIVGFA